MDLLINNPEDVNIESIACATHLLKIQLER